MLNALFKVKSLCGLNTGKGVWIFFRNTSLKLYDFGFVCINSRILIYEFHNGINSSVLKVLN